MSQKVLVIHGLDEAAKTELEKFLTKLEVSATFIQETRDISSGLIEKADQYSGVSALIGLFSDDEVGTLRSEFPRNAMLKALPAVVLSFGVMVGKLGVDKAVVLHHKRQNFELPCKEGELATIPMDAEKNWQFLVMKKLKDLGFVIDANKLL